MKDYYKVLGVSRTASWHQIKHAYRSLCKKHHPDKNSRPDSTRIIQDVNEAYDVLSDAAKKSTYDFEIRSQETAHARTAEPSHTERPRQSERPHQQEEPRDFSCEACGAQDASLRFSIFYSVQSFGFTSSRQKHPHVLCAACRTKRSLRLNLSTILIGWWHPIGFFWTLSALFENALGGEQPKDNNAALLAILGYNFYRKGRLQDAREALIYSLALKTNAEAEGLLVFLRKCTISINRPSFRKRFCSWKAHPVFYNVPLFAAFFGGVIALLAANSESNRGTSAYPPTRGTPPSYYPQTQTTPSSHNNTSVSRQEPRFAEPELQIPQHGLYSVSSGYNSARARCPLHLKTRMDGSYYFVKLEDWHSRQTIALYFVYAGQVLSAHVPPGSYRLKYANGQHWYGIQYLFGPNTTVSMADTRLDFTEDSDGYSGHTIELILQVNGNLKTKKLPKEDF